MRGGVLTGEIASEAGARWALTVCDERISDSFTSELDLIRIRVPSNQAVTGGRSATPRRTNGKVVGTSASIKVLFGAVLGIALLVGSGVVSLVVAGVVDFVVCWLASRITGEPGYMQVGWVFALIAWPVLWLVLFVGSMGSRPCWQIGVSDARRKRLASA